MFSFASSSDAISAPKRPRPEHSESPPPAPGELGSTHGDAADAEMMEEAEEMDFRFYDIDTEPATRERKVAGQPREFDTFDSPEFEAAPPSALSPDFEGPEGWKLFLQQRLTQLDNIIRDLRQLCEVERSSIPGAAQLFDSIIMQIHSERAELEYTLGQTNAANYNFPLGDATDSRSMLAWRNPLERRRKMRQRAKEASIALYGCYGTLVGSSPDTVTTAEDNSVFDSVLARLRLARQHLEQAVNPPENKRVSNSPRIWRARTKREPKDEPH